MSIVTVTNLNLAVCVRRRETNADKKEKRINHEQGVCEHSILACARFVASGIVYLLRLSFRMEVQPGYKARRLR